MYDELKIALVGCGFVANQHLSAWVKMKRQVRVVAVCDINNEASKAMAKRWNIPRYYAELSALLSQEEISVVDICTPPQTHALLAIQAMESGCHVLLEKPMTVTTKDAKEILHVQKITGMKLGVVHNWLFLQSIPKARCLIKKRHIGRIMGVQIETLFTKDDHMTADREHWSHKLPGGRFGETLAHPVYLLQNFLGPLKVESVSTGKTGDYPWMPQDELRATFKSYNRLGAIYVSFNSPRETVLVNIYGSKGILRVDLLTSTVVQLRHIVFKNAFTIGFDVLKQAHQLLMCAIKNAGKVALGKYPTGHETYIHLFVDSVINDKKPPVTPEDGYEVVKVLEEICKRIPRLRSNAKVKQIEG